MPTRETAPTGAPCWIDLMTSDTDRARAFYTQLFGWTAGESSEEFGGYFQFFRDGVPVAGAMPAMADAGPPDIWSIYLSTDDVTKTVEVATANGAQVYAPAMPVADLGSMAVIADSGGAAIGMWQPETFHGIGVLAEPRAPGWFELFTRDFQGTLDFYRTVFGWEVTIVGDTDDFRYATAMDGEDQVAGVMDATAFLPEGVPAHWSVYISVDDTDAALAQVVALGGAIVDPAQDTPYGRLASATDPMGARFKLVGRNAS